MPRFIVDGNIEEEPPLFGPAEIPEPEYSDPFEDEDWGEEDEYDEEVKDCD